MAVILYGLGLLLTIERPAASCDTAGQVVVRKRDLDACLLGLRHHAELLQHPQHIVPNPDLLDLPIHEAQDVDPLQRELLARWRDTVEVAGVCAAHSEALHYLVSVGDEIFD